MGADSKKIRIIPNGVDPAVFFPAPRKERRTAGELTVLTMARIYRSKGLNICCAPPG